MKYLSLVLVLSLAVVAISCSGDNLLTIEDESPAAETLAKAAQGDRAEWEIFEGWGGTLEVGDWPTGELSCLNGGEGEDAWFAGSYQWYKKETVTPSGNVLLNLMYTMGEDSPGGVPVRMIGMETGEVWPAYKYNSHFFMHTKEADGLTYFVQPDQIWHHNQTTGERVKVFYLWKTVWDADFNVVSDNSRLIGCARMRPK